jgi:hypothetical protein
VGQKKIGGQMNKKEILEEAKRVRVQKAWYELKHWLREDKKARKQNSIEKDLLTTILAEMKELEKVKT